MLLHICTDRPLSAHARDRRHRGGSVFGWRLVSTERDARGRWLGEGGQRARVARFRAGRPEASAARLATTRRDATSLRQGWRPCSRWLSGGARMAGGLGGALRASGPTSLMILLPKSATGSADTSPYTPEQCAAVRRRRSFPVPRN